MKTSQQNCEQGHLGEEPERLYEPSDSFPFRPNVLYSPSR